MSLARQPSSVAAAAGDQVVIGNHIGYFTTPCSGTSPGNTCDAGRSCAALGWCRTTCFDPSFSYDAAAATPSPVCGDGLCNGVESCTSCERDCGLCVPAELRGVIRTCKEEKQYVKGLLGGGRAEMS